MLTGSHLLRGLLREPLAVCYGPQVLRFLALLLHSTQVQILTQKAVRYDFEVPWKLWGPRSTLLTR